MKVLGIQNIEIGKLRLPGDWRSIVASAEAKERAESLKTVGQLNEPIVRAADLRLLAGRRRVAGHVINKETHVLCKLVDCTDLEARIIEATENSQRWHNPKRQRELALQLIDLYEAQLSAGSEASPEHELDPAAPQGPPPKKPRGRQKSLRRAARERLAKETGMTERHLRRIENKKNREPKAADIELFGMTVSENFLNHVALVQVPFRFAIKHLQAAQKELTQLKAAELGFPGSRLDRLIEQVHDACARVIAMKPSSLCPYCKGLPGLLERCATCLTTGYVGEQQVNGAPQELLDILIPLVVKDGKLISADEYIAAKEMVE